jgi:hypothetical protein
MQIWKEIFSVSKTPSRYRYLGKKYFKKILPVVISLLEKLNITFLIKFWCIGRYRTGPYSTGYVMQILQLDIVKS